MVDKDLFAELHLKYTAGDCHVMALALNQEFGYHIHALWDPETDSSEAHCLPGDPGALMHWFVVTPDGKAMDFNGITTVDGLKEDWGFQPHERVVTQHDPREVWMRCPPEDGEIEEALEVFRSIHLDNEAPETPLPMP